MDVTQPPPLTVVEEGGKERRVNWIGPTLPRFPANSRCGQAREHILVYFINTNIGVLSGRLLSLEGVIKTFILLGGAFVGQVARPLRQLYMLQEGQAKVP